MTVEIKNRWTDEVLFECEAPDSLSGPPRLGYAAIEAVKAHANLTGADLKRADLTGAFIHFPDQINAELSGPASKGRE